MSVYKLRKCFLLIQFHFPQLSVPEPTLDDIQLDPEEVEEALVYTGTPSAPIGGVIDSVTGKDAVSYYAGYVAMKLGQYHLSKLKIHLNDCHDCSSIRMSQDLNVHLFTSFKEYTQNVDSS